MHVADEGVERILIEAPSGLAGNLLVSCLTRAGVSRSSIDSLPEVLDLPGFSVVWDEHGVCDGDGGLFSGEVQDLVEHVVSRIQDPGVASFAGEALWSLLEPGPVRDHTACDSAFDVTAFFTGLAALGWPKVTVVGPLPSTAADNPISRRLLADWKWTSVAVDVELVTPTAAGLLRAYACAQITSLPAGAI